MERSTALLSGQNAGKQQLEGKGPAVHEVSRRTFAALAGAAAFGAGLAGEPAVAAEPFDGVKYVHPELRAAYARLLPQVAEPLTFESLAAMRRSAQQGPGSTTPTWTEEIVPGSPGQPDVRVVVVNARPDTQRPAIVYMHGGGFVSGSAKQRISSLQQTAEALGCVIISVDYRLAPETRFPGALEDNYAALKWVYGNAERLGADRSRIAVMGESAGGGHAAMLAIAARDRGEVPLAYQALIYPMLDDRTGSTRKTPPHQGMVIWTPQRNVFGWTALLGTPAGSGRAPYGAVPSRVRNLAGLPPAFIGVGSLDLFVDEDIEYARRLMDAGVSVTLNVVAGAFHTFPYIAPDAAPSRRFRTAWLQALSEGLAR